MLFLVLLLVFSVHICGETYLNVTDNSESQTVFSSNTTVSRETISEEASISHSVFSSTTYFNGNLLNVTQFISSNSRHSVTNPLIIPSNVNPLNRITSMFTHGTTSSNIAPLKNTTQELTSSKIREREIPSETTSLTTDPETTIESSSSETSTPKITIDTSTSTDTTTDTAPENTTTDTAPENTTTDTVPENTTTPKTTVTTPENNTTDPTTSNTTTTDTTLENTTTTSYDSTTTSYDSTTTSYDSTTTSYDSTTTSYDSTTTSYDSTTTSYDSTTTLYDSTTDAPETTTVTAFPNTTTDAPTTNYTSDIPNTDTPETTEVTTSQSTYIPTTTDGANTTDDANTTSSTISVEPPVEKDKSTAVLLGILLPVLVIGVSVILWMGYRSGRLVWPPKYLSSDAPDNIRPSYIALKKFPAHCDQMLEVPSKINSEFELLKTLSDDIIYSESFIAAQMPDNKVKNRYTNILPYDSTRVKLIPEGNDFFSDYINASYIKGYSNEIEYIATQGPKEETSRDFWRMIYQEPVKVIIMVTQLEEMGKPKCHKYFPNLRENIVLGDISIWCTTELHFPIYTSRTLVLTKDDRKRSITHLHFREWPDFGCPSTPDLMLQFCQVMRQHIIVAQPGITVVHCSAGVGRTGTLIAFDILMQQINENKKISVFDTVYKLRKHRVNMVQSEAQYMYIYKCLKEALENPSYLASENSSSSSMEPIYENVECTRMSPSSKIPAEVVTIESEFVF